MSPGETCHTYFTSHKPMTAATAVNASSHGSRRSMKPRACSPKNLSSTAHKKKRAPRVTALATTKVAKSNCAAPEAIVMIL